MNAETLKAVNILTLGDLLVPRLRNENVKLKEILSEVKNNNERINFCVIHEVFITSRTEVFSLQEALGSIIGKVEEQELVEQLNAVVEELSDLAGEISDLESGFHDYLHCPASENPEP